MRSATSTDRVPALWGFAEATLFFVVPDVWISHVAVRHGLRAGLTASAGALAGALAGGAVMHRWGTHDRDGAVAVMLRLPAIDGAMVVEVDDEVRRRGAAALLLGPLRGRPYKLYAVAAGHRGVLLRHLRAWTIPGRLARFALSALAAATARRVLRAHLGLRARTAASWLTWAGIYALLWTLGPGRGADLTAPRRA